MEEDELIAKFMGLEKTILGKWEKGEEDKTIWVEKGAEYPILRYKESWNWLMPVVEKIAIIYPQAFDIDHELGPLSDLAGIQICDGKERIYKAVVEFIKWYNTQLKIS